VEPAPDQGWAEAELQPDRRSADPQLPAVAALDPAAAWAQAAEAARDLFSGPRLPAAERAPAAGRRSVPAASHAPAQAERERLDPAPAEEAVTAPVEAARLTSAAVAFPAFSVPAS
jgi:hypothetical protein